MLRLVAPRWSSSLEQQTSGVGAWRDSSGGTVAASPETLHELLGGHFAMPACATHPRPGSRGRRRGRAQCPTAPAALAAGVGAKGCAVLPPSGRNDRRGAETSGIQYLFRTRARPAHQSSRRKSLGASTFSADPRVVAECGASFVEGLSRHKILACARHFPGLGGVPPAPGGELPLCGRSMAELWRC